MILAAHNFQRRPMQSKSYMAAFLTPIAVPSGALGVAACVSHSACVPGARALRRGRVLRRGGVRMLQSPNSDGPPSLDAFDAARRATSKMQGPLVTFSTERASLSEGEADEAIEAAARACVAKAVSEQNAKSSACVVHVTFTPDLSAGAVSAGALAGAGGVELLGRSVAKKGGTPYTIEVLVLGGGNSMHVGYSTATGDAASAMAEALHMARATEGFAASSVIFGLFATSADERGARDILGSNAPMYGGPASDGETGAVLVGRQMVRPPEATGEGGGHAAGVVLVNGSTSFLVSAVVKSWAQPAFVEALEFLKPRYRGDDGDDLLEAIKFDDWDTFERCLGKVGPNFQWVSRQHQSPLLAAAGRGRTRMVERILREGGDVNYRNDGGFNAVMYTLRLTDYGDDFVKKQMDILQKAGADPNDTDVIIPDRSKQ